MSVLISSSPPLPSLFTDLYQASSLKSSAEHSAPPCVPRKLSKSALTFPDAPFRPQLSFVRKKSVVFADSMGLPLTQVKVVKSDELPPSAPKPFSFSSTPATSPPSPPTTLPALRLNFSQPVSRSNFLGSILRKHVGIENVMVSKFRLSGTILVHNLCFQKEVCVRYSKDYWTSHNEITADYVSTVSRDIDKFTFTLLLPDTLPPGARVEMCARLTVGGETFWDNNSSQNYQIECVPLPPSLTKSVPLPRPMITPISLNPVPSFADTKENIYYY